MTPKEIAEKSWTLWNDYYKDGDKSSDEILTELIADMEALKIYSNLPVICRCKGGKQGRTVDENYHQICDVCGGN